MMNTDDRRRFMKQTAGTAVTFGLLAGTTTWGSPNDTIRVGVVGLHGRGNDHIRGYLGLKDQNVELAALCDVDETVLQQRAGEVKKRTDKDIPTFTDIKAMLESDIDAVSIATPNHWHSLMGIWACQAGKDAYVEKPCCHNIHEGRMLVEAARKYNRIVEHGTQGRSVSAFREAMQLLHDGYLGEVYYAKGICYKWRDTIGHTPDATVPEGVHYNLWEGPAPDRPFSRNRFHYNWHWQWDYGNGDIGNQGIHEMDIARWGLGVKLPRLVSAIGGHFMFDDDQQTPNTLVATYKYPDVNKMLVFEVRHWMTPNELHSSDQWGNLVGDIFLGSEGYMITHEYGTYRTFMGRNHKPGKQGTSSENHFENFIQAVRSRKREDLHAEIEEGFLSASLCHLANASYITERTLQFDPDTLRCLHDDEANAYLMGQYRSPFVVPDEV